MSVYKRGNRWHAQVDLPDRGDGKRHRRAATFRLACRKLRQRRLSASTLLMALSNLRPRTN
jgi:hypothetical protein